MPSSTALASSLSPRSDRLARTSPDRSTRSEELLATEVFADVCTLHRVNNCALGRATHVDEKVIRELRNGDAPMTLWRAVRIAKAGSPVGGAFLRALADRAEGVRGPGLDEAANVRKLVVEAGDVARALDEGLAGDGVLDDAEIARLDREWADVEERAAAARRDLRARRGAR